MHQRSLAFLAASLFYLAASSGIALAAGGVCPSNAPVTGNNCYFIAASGVDTNNGTSESTPWAHAPGMPNCANTCLTVQTALGPKTLINTDPGVGFIFRGGDTWHFGNNGATPYTGGTWLIWWSGSPTTCAYGSYAGCFYIGVDTTWFSGSSWARPIMTADNPLALTSVSSCTYQVASGGAPGVSNTMVQLGVGNYTANNSFIYFDSLEFTGLCSNDTAGDGKGNVMIVDGGTYNNVQGTGLTIRNNLYLHGWTVTTAELSNPSSPQCVGFGGGGNYVLIGNVFDGSDSNPGACQIMIFPRLIHVKDNIFRYAQNIVASACHDIHDNIFEHFYAPIPATHGNALECNVDSALGTPNVYYNNIMRHFDPSFGKGGEVDLWFCPNTTPEYWFNNLMYDLNPGAGLGSWDIAGAPGYAGCSNSGGQFMFNNTLVDTVQPCHLQGSNGTGGVYLTVYNEHLIGTGYDGTGCTGGASSGTNISMSDATATIQGYTTGSRGTAGANTCANETTTPCAPIAASLSTVAAGLNVMSYCTALASYSSEYAIGTEAANACKHGTTDGCVYNASTHTMVCPAQTALARPPSGAWGVGAYQYSSSGNQGLQAQTSLTTAVH